MRRAALSSLALLLSAACGGGGTSQPPPGTFIALQRDFLDFEQWEAFGPPKASTGSTHLAGPFTVYLKARPPKGSTAFPVGTVIVKSAFPTELAGEEKLFAMAKRGGDFNADGAAGWEWFELVRSKGVPVILWRGIGAPAGEHYSQVDGTCNDCHRGSLGNDFVNSLPLGEL